MPHQQSKKRVGRPTGKSDAREQLITHARELFVSMPYDKVSTRLVAEKAGVNSAMIRYYFGNKEGLFETMVRETLEPFKSNLARLLRGSEQVTLLDVLTLQMRHMRQMPDFPKLVFQSMHMPATAVQRKLLLKVFSGLADPAAQMFVMKQSEQKYMRDGLDPRMVRLSIISLMMFPFLAPAPLLELHDIELTDEFLEGYLTHSIDLMNKGLFKPSESFE